MTPERAVEWMAEKGITGYKTRIQNLMNCKSYDPDVDWAEVQEIAQEALDRYNDWESDPLP